MVYEHFSIQMVKLVLHNPCQKSFYHLIMFYKILIHISYVYLAASLHRLVNTRQTETTFLHRYFLTLYHINMGIYISLAKIFIFGIILRKHIQINNNDTNRQTDLRSGKSYPVSMIHRFKHIFNQFLQIRIVHSYIFRYLSENRLTIYINR